MGFETIQGDTLNCPRCNEDSKKESFFKVTRLQSGVLVFRCNECGESLEHQADVTVEAIIKYAGKHLGPSAMGVIGGLFGRGGESDD